MRSAFSDKGSSKSRKDHFPIVGIGASAGGLEALTALLKALPADTAMAFLLVSHMDPTHESLLDQLLSKATAMPISEVIDRTRARISAGMFVALEGEQAGRQPGHVYGSRPIKIDHGVLRLAHPYREHMPIDSFCSALAKDQQDQAIGVILSGTASDGTRGVKAIKAVRLVGVAQL